MGWSSSSFVPRDELLAVGGREEEAAALVVGEELDREQREPARLLEPAQLAGRDVQLEEAVRDVRVVVEVPGAWPAGATCGAAARPVGEGPRRNSASSRARLAQSARPSRRAGLRERREREAVPRGDRLVVARRLRPLRARSTARRAPPVGELAAQDRTAVLERLQELGRRGASSAVHV